MKIAGALRSPSLADGKHRALDLKLQGVPSMSNKLECRLAIDLDRTFTSAKMLSHYPLF